MRLLKFIPGDILAQTEITPVLCYETGAVVATLHNLLKVSFLYTWYGKG